MSRLTDPFPPTYMGMPVIVSPNAFEQVVDWSCARSPSRAKRRYARGKRKSVPTRQNPTAYTFHGKMIIHPDLFRRLILASERHSI